MKIKLVVKEYINGGHREGPEEAFMKMLARCGV